MRLIIIIAGLGGFLYGVDFGVIAAAEPYMKAMGAYTDAQISHIVGAVLLIGSAIICQRESTTQHLGRCLEEGACD